uniref:Uncharacterized protein n=1 Tax=Cannabis sativa TaxID=3483 RepID=A0A803PUW1_CANSA
MPLVLVFLYYRTSYFLSTTSVKNGLSFPKGYIITRIAQRFGAFPVKRKIVKMKSSETSTKAINSHGESGRSGKPHFRPAKDDTKPVLQDPILRSDPIETEEAVLLLPPFPIVKENSKIGLRNH